MLPFTAERSIEMKIGAVIAAAGMSSRMKAFKPLLALRGSTMIGTAVSSLQAAGADEIAVVTGNNAKELENYLSKKGVACLYNERYETTDMLYSARIGLDALKDKCGRVFFLPGDVPLFSIRSLRLMLDEMDSNGCDILLPIHDGKMGHPILISSVAIPALTQYKGGNGLKGAIDSFNGIKKSIELDDAGMIMDADRPEDYELLKAYVRSHPDDTDTRNV